MSILGNHGGVGGVEKREPNRDKPLKSPRFSTRRRPAVITKTTSADLRLDRELALRNINEIRPGYDL